MSCDGEERCGGGREGEKRGGGGGGGGAVYSEGGGGGQFIVRPSKKDPLDKGHFSIKDT